MEKSQGEKSSLILTPRDTIIKILIDFYLVFFLCLFISTYMVSIINFYKFKFINCKYFHIIKHS